MKTRIQKQIQKQVYIYIYIKNLDSLTLAFFSNDSASFTIGSIPVRFAIEISIRSRVVLTYLLTKNCVKQKWNVSLCFS